MEVLNPNYFTTLSLRVIGLCVCWLCWCLWWSLYLMYSSRWVNLGHYSRITTCCVRVNPFVPQSYWVIDAYSLIMYCCSWHILMSINDCYLGIFMGLGWYGDIREVMVGFMIMMNFFLLVMGYKVAPLLHTLAPCYSFFYNHDHGLVVGFHLLVQEACTLFCCFGWIREAFQTLIGLSNHFCLVFAGPFIVLQRLLIVMGHLGWVWVGDIRVVMVDATDKSMVCIVYRGCMVALLLHTLSLCTPLYNDFICGLGWGTFLGLLQVFCRFGVCHGEIRMDDLSDLFLIFFFYKTDHFFEPQNLLILAIANCNCSWDLFLLSVAVRNLWLLFGFEGPYDVSSALGVGFNICCFCFLKAFKIDAVTCYYCWISVAATVSRSCCCFCTRKGKSVRFRFYGMCMGAAGGFNGDGEHSVLLSVCVYWYKIFKQCANLSYGSCCWLSFKLKCWFICGGKYGFAINLQDYLCYCGVIFCCWYDCCSIWQPVENHGCHYNAALCSSILKVAVAWVRKWVKVVTDFIICCCCWYIKAVSITCCYFKIIEDANICRFELPVIIFGGGYCCCSCCFIKSAVGLALKVWVFDGLSIHNSCWFDIGIASWSHNYNAIMCSCFWCNWWRCRFAVMSLIRWVNSWFMSLIMGFRVLLLGVEVLKQRIYGFLICWCKLHYKQFYDSSSGALKLSCCCCSFTVAVFCDGCICHFISLHVAGLFFHSWGSVLLLQISFLMLKWSILWCRKSCAIDLFFPWWPTVLQQLIWFIWLLQLLVFECSSCWFWFMVLHCCLLPSVIDGLVLFYRCWYNGFLQIWVFIVGGVGIVGCLYCWLYNEGTVLSKEWQQSIDRCEDHLLMEIIEVHPAIEDKHGVKMHMFFAPNRVYNTWFYCIVDFISCQVLDYRVVFFMLVLFPKHILGSQLD